MLPQVSAVLTEGIAFVPQVGTMPTQVRTVPTQVGTTPT